MICTKCHKDKPNTSFLPRTDKGVTRLRRQCQDCGIRAERLRSTEPWRIMARIEWNKTEACKTYQRIWGAKYYQQHKVEVAAKTAVRKAIAAGTIKKPTSCKLCKRESKLYGHHTDYTKVLDVLWLCASCHRRIHIGTLSIV